MKRLNFLTIIIFSIFVSSPLKADSNIPLKEYLENKDIEEGSTQIFLLNRCSAIYTYASAILLGVSRRPSLVGSSPISIINSRINFLMRSLSMK